MEVLLETYQSKAVENEEREEIDEGDCESRKEQLILNMFFGKPMKKYLYFLHVYN
jgi:hypothetical protein